MEVLWGFFLLIAIVVIHEAGHAIAARAFGVGVLKFSIGFGPGITIWKGKNFPIILSPLLLGGYVSLKSVGPAYALAKAYSDLNKLHSELERQQADPVKSQKLTAKITALEKKIAEMTATAEKHSKTNGICLEDAAYWKRMVIFVAGVTSNLISAIIMLTIVYAFADGAKVTLFGLSTIISAGVNEWYMIPVQAASRTMQMFFFVLGRLFLIVPALAGPVYETVVHQAPTPHTGVIGMLQIGANAATAGWASYLMMAHFFSVIIAAFNLLPLGILDGGQIAVGTVARIFGYGKILKVFQAVIMIFGIVLLAALLLLTVGSDIVDVYNWLKQ